MTENLLAKGDALLSLVHDGLVEAITSDDGLDGGRGECLLKEIRAWQAEFVREEIGLDELIADLNEEATSCNVDEYARDLFADASHMLRRLSDMIYNVNQGVDLDAEAAWKELERITLTETETIGDLSKSREIKIKDLSDLAALTSFSDPIVVNVNVVGDTALGQAAHNVAHQAAAFKKFFENKYRGETIHCEYIRELFAAVAVWAEECELYERGDQRAELSEAPVG